MMTPHIQHLINLRRQDSAQQVSELEHRLQRDIALCWRNPLGTSADMTPGEKLRAQLECYGLVKPLPKSW